MSQNGAEAPARVTKPLPARGPRRAPALRLPAPLAQAVARRNLPWRAILAPALALWLATRIAYAALTWLYPLVTGPEFPSSAPLTLSRLPQAWVQWDGVWFIQIARAGYAAPVDSAYFPLYPAAIRVVSLVIGPHWATAALIASNLGALLAFAGVAALAAQMAPAGQEEARARLAALVFAAYPLAFFLVAPYSDGLFAGLAALALVCGMRRRWGWAALCALLATLCRSVGVALIAPLLWEAFQAWRARRMVDPERSALGEAAAGVGAALAPLVALAAFSGFLWVRFGDPLAFIHAEAAWTHTALSPLLSIPLAILAVGHTALFSPYQSRVLLDLVPLLAAIVITSIAARRARLAPTLYTFGVLYIIASEPVLHIDLFESAGRYLIAAVPIFVVLAGWLRRSSWVLPAYLWTGVVLQSLLTTYFLGHGFMI